MTREQLAHVLRAAARIARDPDILVVGSQAILGSYREEELPEVAWLSVEADLAFFDAEGGTQKADQVDGAIGELSHFHETYRYYGQGVDLHTAKLPDGWEQRLVPFERRPPNPPAQGAWRSTIWWYRNWSRCAKRTVSLPRLCCARAWSKWKS